MMRNFLQIAFFCLSTTVKGDLLDLVDPLIGSNGGGNVFPGATLPYGMVKAVADVDGQNTGGFSTDNSNVTGFSSMHDSGTGGNPSLGNFPLFPQYCPEDDLNNCKFPKSSRRIGYKNESIVARPGYFSLTLDNDIRAEMTVTQHAALYNFIFPTQSRLDGSVLHPLILLDLDDLWNSRQNASVSVDPTTGQIKGNGTFLPSFGAGSYVQYFCADFSGAEIFETGMFVNDRAGTEPKELYVTRGFNLFYIQAGSFVRFQRPENGTISARVGVSYISTERACENARVEIPNMQHDFLAVRTAAEEAWRQKLSVVQITSGGASLDLQKTFYSGLYRIMIDPQDVTGENPAWESDEPYFDSFYCIWDSFRAQHPLLTIVDPATQSRMVRSLLDTYKHRGWLPDCQMSLCKGWTQGGSNADVVITDAFVKNLTGIDWEVAYEAVAKDAEVEPIDWSSNGRGGLLSWKKLNYIPYLDYDYLGFGTNSRSISRTVEYSYNDFCLATLASGLGRDPNPYLQRSGNWKNLYKSDQRSIINGSDSGFVGFLQPRFLNGTWGYQDPIGCSPLSGTFCSLTSNPSETFESSVWEYQFYVPHDLATLIDTLGGAESFIKRADYAFSVGLLDITNEPVFLTAYSYHYASRPALSTRRIHDYIPASFNSSYNGLPGNDDNGGMGAFAAFGMLGIFPNAGQNVYLLNPPFFESWTITTADKNATVTVTNFDPDYKRLYIQSAKLNGQDYRKSWITHEFFTMGGTLELEVGEQESSWGTRDEDLPPSLGSRRTGQMEL